MSIGVSDLLNEKSVFNELPNKFVKFYKSYQSYLHKNYQGLYSHNQSLRLISRFDNISFDDIIFGVYLFKNNRVNPGFKLANSLDFGFIYQTLSWTEIRYVNDQALIKTDYEPHEETLLTSVPKLFATIHKNFDPSKVTKSKVVLKTCLITLSAIAPKFLAKPNTAFAPKGVSKPSSVVAPMVLAKSNFQNSKAKKNRTEKT
jgi:hypothetical protein